MPKRKKTLGIVELLERFPDEDSARKWFEDLRWPDGKRDCPHCGSLDTYCVPNENPLPYHCRDCHKYFSVKTGTVMRRSKIPLQKWLYAMYLLTSNPKGASSLKIARELNIPQNTAWMMAQKIREGWVEDRKLTGTVEVDETFIGGKESNKPPHKRTFKQGPVGKTIVIGMKSREENKIIAKVIPTRSKKTMQGFIKEHVSPKAMIYTDDHRGYIGLPFEHESVNHSRREYVRGSAHTNGIEGFWATLKRGYHGTYHCMSPKHLERYVTEFAGRHNVKDLDTIDQMAFLAKGIVGKKLTYKELVKEVGG